MFVEYQFDYKGTSCQLVDGRDERGSIHQTDVTNVEN